MLEIELCDMEILSTYDSTCIDTYYDSASLQLHRNNVSLRMRKRDAMQSFILKTQPSRVGKCIKRREFVVPVEENDIQKRLREICLQGDIAWRNLTAVLDVIVSRIQVKARSANHLFCFCFDHYHFTHGHSSSDDLYEIEIEYEQTPVPNNTEIDFFCDRLMRNYHYEVSYLSKYKRAVAWKQGKEVYDN